MSVKTVDFTDEDNELLYRFSKDIKEKYMKKSKSFIYQNSKAIIDKHIKDNSKFGFCLVWIHKEYVFDLKDLKKDLRKILKIYLGKLKPNFIENDTQLRIY